MARHDRGRCIRHDPHAAERVLCEEARARGRGMPSVLRGQSAQGVVHEERRDPFDGLPNPPAFSVITVGRPAAVRAYLPVVRVVAADPA